MSDNNNSREKVYRLVEIKGLNLKNAKDRLFTFHALWSEENEFKDTRSLAAQGFYSSGHSDMSICVFCEVQLCGWKRGDDPKRRHMQSSPQCRFINGEDTGDIPLPPRNDYLQRSLYQANGNMEERAVKPRPSGNRATGDHDDDKALSNDGAPAIYSGGINTKSGGKVPQTLTGFLTSEVLIFDNSAENKAGPVCLLETGERTGSSLVQVSSNLMTDEEQSNFVSTTQLSNYTGENMPVSTSSRATEERSDLVQVTAGVNDLSNLEPENDAEVVEPNTGERSDTVQGAASPAGDSDQNNLEPANEGTEGTAFEPWQWAWICFLVRAINTTGNSEQASSSSNDDDDSRSRTASSFERNAPLPGGTPPFRVIEPHELENFVALGPDAEEIDRDAIGTNEQRLQELEQDKSCAVCLTANKTVVLLFCGHYCVCKACAAKLRECPVCKKIIRLRLHIFDT